MKKYITILSAGIFFTAVFAAYSADVWHEPKHHFRVALTIPAFSEETSTGVVITGKDFYRWTGFPRPPVDTLRLWDEKKPVPLQIEEMDGTEKIVTEKPNGILDDNDRMVFLANPAESAQKLYLYYGGQGEKVGQDVSQLKIEEKPGVLIPITIINGEMTLGIRGGGFAEDTSINRIENHGRGAIPLFEWQGVKMTDFRRAWGNYFPQGFASHPGVPLWSEPAVLFRGPVRTLVEIRCQNYTQKKDDTETFSGNITHYISVWHNAPIVDFEEFVDYKATEFTWTWPYSMTFPPGKVLDENDRLLITLANKVFVLPLTQKAEEIKSSPWRTFYSTDNPEEGWFALQDTVEKTGLAVFYEKMDTIRYRSQWVTYRPSLHPDVSIRTNPYGTAEVNLSFRDRAFCSRGLYKREIRYVCLKDESAETVRNYYKIWAEPIDSIIKVDFPETSPYL